MIENFPKKNNSCHTNLQVSAAKMLLFTAQGPLIATIRGGIPSFASQKPPLTPVSCSCGMLHNRAQMLL